MWAFVLTTKTSAMPDRLLHVLTRPQRIPSRASKPIVRFADIATDSGRPVGSTILEHHEADVRVIVHRKLSFGRLRRQPEGIAFPIPGDTRLRFELSFDDPNAVEEVRVKVRDGAGKCTPRWVLNCSGRTPPIYMSKKTYVLRPGRKSGPFAPVGRSKEGEGKTAELLVELRRVRRRTSFTVHRASAAGPDLTG